MTARFIPFVIPAKAGIHLLTVPFLKGISWTPASAGVTMAYERISA